MMGGDVPDPFGEAKDQLIRERSEDIAVANKRIDKLERFLEETRVTLMAELNGLVTPVARLSHNDLIDRIEEVLRP